MEPKEPALKPSDELIEIEHRKRPVPRTPQEHGELKPSPALREIIERKGWRK